MALKNEVMNLGFLASLAMTISMSAQVDSIQVSNPGFENRAGDFVDGQHRYPQPALDIWRHFEVDNNGGPLRLWNPGLAGTSLPGFGGNAPEGQMVMLVQTRYNDDEFHNPPQIRHFEAVAQLLSETFVPATNYILKASVGRPAGSLWSGYTVQLVVGGQTVDGATYAGRVQGGTVIAQDTNTLFIGGDTFVTSVVGYAASEAFTNLAGLPLQIRLCALEDPNNHATTSLAVFDDVSLVSSVEPLPPPPPPPLPTGALLVVR